MDYNSIKKAVIISQAMGKCYHTDPRYCSKCEKRDHDYPNYFFENDDYDYSKDRWDNFGKLWTWTIKQEWWIEFKKNYVEYLEEDIHPTKFSDLVVNFLSKNHICNECLGTEYNTKARVEVER